MRLLPCTNISVFIGFQKSWRFAAAKLGRRSRKMRESIAEACKTIEDNQTAQALHGLLSLKADSTTGGAKLNTVDTNSISIISPTSLDNHQSDMASTILTTAQGDITSPNDPSLDTAISLAAVTAPIASVASSTLADAAQQVLDASSQKKTGTADSEQQLMFRLEQARQCNTEVLNVSLPPPSLPASLLPSCPASLPLSLFPSFLLPFLASSLHYSVTLTHVFLYLSLSLIGLFLFHYTRVFHSRLILLI